MFRLPMTFVEIFPVGVLVSLVSAAVLRNPRVLPARGCKRAGRRGCRGALVRSAQPLEPDHRGQDCGADGVVAVVVSAVVLVAAVAVVFVAAVRAEEVGVGKEWGGNGRV